MSANAFYQTLYQTDQLFRLPGESWGATPAEPVAAEQLPDVADELIVEKPDLLADLDRLAAGPVVVVAQAPMETLIAPPESVTALPPAPPRPSTPSVRPPDKPSTRPVQLNHKVLLLADEELDPSNLLFLEKILKAVNLNINGVDLLNLNGAKDIDFAAMVQDKHIHHFITFGVPFTRIKLDIGMDRYHPVRFFGINFLMADSLPTIEADQNLKRRLWGSLQQLFLWQDQPSAS
ncbi:hypothetical protein [Spirosoma rhododendri]|uniref:Uncharacterized protein n=1 Tax=Spirosoma rhododendri TaxID=2728024 RepID=A0A7L5DS37_9BACT|nr:hypothetical protein [Spirosoma rhododendri]QJD80422.1 hypothetical protein HH216_19830 [Spirosoma rhododendri]